MNHKCFQYQVLIQMLNSESSKQLYCNRCFLGMNIPTMRGISSTGNQQFYKFFKYVEHFPTLSN